MDLFELVATLGIDTNGFTSGLQGALNTGLGWLKNFSIQFAKDVLKDGMAFDKQMSAVEAVLGKEEGTVENMTRLRKFALEQAEDSIFTADQTAEAYYYMGMAGWKTEQMLGGLPGIMALAAASGEDLGMVSDIVTDNLTAFGWSADRAGDFADILAQAATNSNTDVKRMGDTFKYVASIAGSLGVDVEDVALAVGTFASNGIKGSMAGTAFRNVLTRLSTNAGETEKDMGALTILAEKLGVQFWDTSGDMRDFGTIVNEARDAWKGLTQEQQIYYSKQIGSQRGMTAWLALMNAAEEDIEKLAEAFDDAEGAAQRMGDVRLDNLWGDIQELNSKMNTLHIALYDDVKAPLRGVVQYATGAIQRITKSVESGGLLGGIKQLGIELHNFGQEYKEEIEALGESLVPVIQAFATEIAPAFTDATVTLGASLGEGILKGLVDQTSKIFSGENQVFNDSIDLYKLIGSDWLDNIGEKLDELLRGAGKTFGEGLKEGVLGQGLLGGLFGGSEGGLLDSLTNYGVAGFIKSAIRGENGIVNNVADQFKNQIPNLTDKVQVALDHAIANGEATIEWDGVVFSVDQTAEEIATAIENGTDDGTKRAESKYRTFEESIRQKLESGAKQIATNLQGEVTAVGPSIGTSLANDIGATGGDAGSRIASGIQNALNVAKFAVNVTGFFTGLANKLGIKKNASAMAAGRIYKQPTIFGYDGGKLLQAGDAGPEAVVGVNSLAHMVENAVARGNSGREVIVPRNQTPQNLEITVKLADDTVLGRAIYRMNKNEERRVGGRITGGAS